MMAYNKGGWDPTKQASQVQETYKIVFGAIFCSFADQLSACTRQIMCYINSELSPVVGTTYRDLRQFVEAIDMSRYFECGFAGSRLIDDECEARSSSDVNMCDNDRQLSGLLCNVCTFSCYVVHVDNTAVLYNLVYVHLWLLVHGQVTIIFIVSFGLSVCLFVQSFSQPSSIRFRSN